MMNREAIALEPEYLLAAQHGCQQVGALMCLDEIQTGFWQPEVFAFRALGLQPDLVVGQRMTAASILSGVLMPPATC
jgi:acetylornithine/succinyldiaminopimelate/putrescine aminotransferase